MGVEDFFDRLKRPDSPNTWLVAPADFFVAPDEVAPRFDVSVSILRDTFKSMIFSLKHVVLTEESGHVLHVVATTPVLRFKDDVWALFVPIAENSSTLALYSGSRLGYWDIGTNRRRLKGWITHLNHALSSHRLS